MARLANPKPKAVIKKPEAAARKATPNGLKRKKPAASTGANPNLVDWDEDLRGWDDGEDVEEESQSPAKRVKVARRKKQDESQNSTKSKKQTKAVASKKSSVKRTPKESSKKVKARAQTPTVASTRPRRQQKKALEYAEDSDIESAEDEVQPLSSPAHDTGRTSVDSEGNAPDQPHDEDILDASTVDRQGSMPTAIDVIEEDARRTQQRNGSRGPAVNVPMSPEVPQSAVEAPIIGQTDDTDLEEVQDSYPKQDTTIASTHDQDPTGFADALATQIEITHLLPQRTSLSSATKFVHDINSARKHTTKSPSVRKTPAPKRPSGSTSHVPALTKVNPTHRLQPDHAENPSKDDSDEASRNPPTPIRLQDIDRTSSRDENLQTQMKPTAVEAPRRPLARLDNLRLEPLIAKTNLKQTPIAQISSVKPPKQPVLRSSLHVLGSIAPVQSPVTPVSLTQREPVQQTHEAPRYQFGLPDQVHSLQSEAPQLDVEVELAEEHDDHVERVACETERGVVSAISNGRHESGSPPVDSHHSPRILAGTTELPATQDTLLISPDPVEDLFQSNTTSPREIPAILGIREDESEEEQEQSDTDSEYQDSDIIEESAHTEVLTELSSSIRRRESQQLSPPRLSIGSPPVQRRLPRLTQAASPAARPQAPEDMGVQLMVTEFAHGQDTIDTSFFKKSRNAPLSVSQKEMPPPPTPIRRRSSTKHGVMVTTANSIGPFVGEKTRDERRLVSKAKAPVLLEVRCEIHRDPSVAPTTPPNVPLQAPTYSSSQSWPAELRKRGRGLIERDASALEASKNQDDTNGEADTTLVGDPQADIEMLDDDSVYPPRNRTRKIQSHNSLAKPQCRRNDRQQRHTIGEETLENEIRESHRPLHSLMTKLADVCQTPFDIFYKLANKNIGSNPSPRRRRRCHRGQTESISPRRRTTTRGAQDQLLRAPQAKTNRGNEICAGPQEATERER